MPITKTYYKVHRCFPDPDYFYMENIHSGSNSIEVRKNGTPRSTDLSYSFDKQTWTDIHNGGSISVPQGSKVYFRSTTGFSLSTSNYYRINCGNFNLGGDIVSLIDYTSMGVLTEIPSGSFIYAFNNNNIINANFTLNGITNIGDAVFYYTFQSTPLITVPDFSNVTTLGDGALEGAFYGCTSLQTPLDLSNVTNVTTGSFRQLYGDCSSFNDAIYPNLSSYSDTYSYGWLAGTAATGVVRKPAGLTIPTNNTSGVPTGWTTEDY